MEIDDVDVGANGPDLPGGSSVDGDARARIDGLARRVRALEGSRVTTLTREQQAEAHPPSLLRYIAVLVICYLIGYAIGELFLSPRRVV